MTRAKRPGTHLVRVSGMQPGLVSADERSAALPIGDPAASVSGPVSVRKARAAPAGRRVNQELVDRMADLRRKGLTFRDIAARLSCSERTARRYAGRVERQLVPPPSKIPEDPEAQRAELVDWCTELLERLWNRFPSVILLDEAIRELVGRVRELRPETLRLVGPNPKMKYQLFREVAGPLYRDYATFESVVRFLEQFPDHRPMFWRPHGAWVEGQEDEAGDP